ncbi:alpha-mannosidase 2 [Coccinella septempunctata]|uniref:alpha-mannosidase 2 n=1 Tax=Coccinella septempunctata TaxID=41139 RepID=UPI001D083D88|nr:alpha-mannosidase 2 [Coccinella septempunctata]
MKMRFRKALTIAAFVFLILIIFMIYSFKDFTDLYNSSKSSITDDFEQNKWLHFENRIRQLESGLNKHHEAVNQIKIAMKNMYNASMIPNSIKASNDVIAQPKKKLISGSEMLYNSHCSFKINISPSSDINMLDTYEKIGFDNKDGGVWKQGWKIEVDEKDWNRNNILKVFVVPHSHNDPGWIKTFEEYYISQTKHILNNMLNKLPEDPRRKFIWAEISFFAMWWDDLSEDEQKQVRKLIENGQLEIVSGGWVMNDEANSHWISIIQQYTDGHQWLQQNLNYTPKSSWSIDPFGMSATQPSLLKRMGLHNMLIQRVHYSVKKHLASTKQLEFRWRQMWDQQGDTDMFTHMMPFYSYDVPHTCGPDPKICCQFDFKRLPGHGLHCPWKIAPQPITDANVAMKANLLLDQYRKKSKLFKTNVVLAPLGDDFRYDHSTEWDVQYNNYQKLFEYMNSHPELHVKAQFGTLSEYFNAVLKELKLSDFPVLNGDFFTYSDRDDHYWSGYYTSRPFYKRMDRVLLYYIRSAQIILTLKYLKNELTTEKETELERMLQEARRSHSLFQHHDGITGTEKDLVVKDYAVKMLSAIHSCQKIIQYCTYKLLLKPDLTEFDKEEIYYNIDDIRHTWNELEEHYSIVIGAEIRTKKIVVYNSLTFTRIEVITLIVSTPNVEVLDANGKRIQCQISPVFEYGSTISQTKYHLSFIATVPAFSFISYTVNALWKHELTKQTVHAAIKIYNQYTDGQRGYSAFPSVEIFPNAREFSLHNSRVTASFNNVGLLKALKAGVHTIPVHLDFAKYGVKHVQETSGAYLFMPDGDAIPIKIDNAIVNVVEGPIVSFVILQLPYVHHTVRLYNTPGADSLGLEIENVVDITKVINFEIAMRLSTNINSTDEFFTDANGYQIIKRKRFSKLPLQANFYPMPTMAYIEDKNTRLTVVTGSPLGCSSLKPGQLEIMLDRRLKQDDNLGLGQGVLDNVPVRQLFRVLLERKTHSCQAAAGNHPSGFPTLSSYATMQSLLNPLVKLLRTNDDDISTMPSYIPTEIEMGIDFSVPALRTNVYFKGKEYLGLILHRQYLDVCFSDRVLLQQFPLSDGSVNVADFLPGLSSARAYNTSLTYLWKKGELDIKQEISLCPMNLQALLIQN